MAIEIWHNPRCSKSRETLALLESNNVQAQIFLYLEEALTANQIASILTKLAITPRELLRNSEEAYKALNLKDNALSDDDLIAAMVNHPKLIQRPIVVHGQQARLGRPPESVLEIL